MEPKPILCWEFVFETSKSVEKYWEKNETITERARVADGWLVRTIIKGNSLKTNSISMTYIPDPEMEGQLYNWKWQSEDLKRPDFPQL